MEKRKNDNWPATLSMNEVQEETPAGALIIGQHKH